MSFISNPVSAKMYVTAVTLRAKIIKAVTKFRGTNGGRNIMPQMKIATKQPRA
jgi:hypothetical protein